MNREDVSIYRYKMSDDIVAEINIFAKIHQYDDRHDFKTAWNAWIDEKSEIVAIEVARLTNLGYEGDVINKMFKSARYYFRKKSNEKTEPKQRRVYVGVEQEMLIQMDTHIAETLKDLQPKDGFADFCKNNLELIRANVVVICEKGITDPVIVQDKIKKTYKNRYFMLTNKVNIK
jgi:hypothetical protein